MISTKNNIVGIFSTILIFSGNISGKNKDKNPSYWNPAITVKCAAVRVLVGFRSENCFTVCGYCTKLQSWKHNPFPYSWDHKEPRRPRTPRRFLILLNKEGATCPNKNIALPSLNMSSPHHICLSKESWGWSFSPTTFLLFFTSRDIF